MDKKKCEWPDYLEEVEKKEKRKLKAQKRKKKSIWLGFKMFGLVGWSVTIPTVIGATFGVWIDTHFEERGAYSWTLMLLFIGLIIGCMNAWYWVKKESNSSNERENDDNT